MQKVRIGFDLGGTNMGAALVSYEGDVLFLTDGPTDAMAAPAVTITAMKGLIGKCFNEAADKGYQVTSIGIGCPGIIDSNTGLVRILPNLPQWQNIELGPIMQEEFKVPVGIDNDVKVATLGEFNFGAGKGYSNLLCITVGTGIGGGIVLNGQLMRGPTQSMGEIGHMTLKKDGPVCGCGNHGCMEALASSLAIIREIKQVLEQGKSNVMQQFVDKGYKLGAYLASQAALEGDPEGQRIMRETGEWIGIGLSNVINLLNPEIIIIGGGVSLAGDILFEPIRAEIAKRALKLPGELVKIVPASLGDSAGMIGASTLI